MKHRSVLFNVVLSKVLFIILYISQKRMDDNNNRGTISLSDRQNVMQSKFSAFNLTNSSVSSVRDAADVGEKLHCIELSDYFGFKKYLACTSLASCCLLIDNSREHLYMKHFVTGAGGNKNRNQNESLPEHFSSCAEYDLHFKAAR